MRPTALGLVLAIVSLGAGQEKPADPPTHSGTALIDRMIQAKWDELKLRPATAASDSEFLRRAYLDIVGTIPTLEATEKFLADSSTDKRAKLIDDLLASDAYALNWAEIWAGTLLGYEADRKVDQARALVEKRVKPMFAENKPYDAFVREVITATGQTNSGEEQESDDPAVNPLTMFFARYQKQAGKEMPQALAGKFARVFMGTQIQCAQCHDHPFDKWTQEDFYGMAAFFTQVNVRRDQKPGKDGKDGKDGKGGKDEKGG